MDVKGVISVLILVLIALGVTVWLGETATSEKDPNGSARKLQSGFDDDREAPPLDEDDQRPKAVIDDTLFEFGMMQVGQTERHTFSIKNEGEDTLVIAKGASTCKCTVSEMPNNEIPPGESADVILEWSPKDISELFSHSARIWTNDPDNRKIDLRVEGQVANAIELIPGTDLDAGIVHEETGAKTPLRIYSVLREQLTEPEVVYPGDWLTFTTKELSAQDLEEASAKAGYEITVQVTPDIPVGTHKELFEIKLKADGEQKQYAITLRCRRRGPVTIIGAPGTVYEDSSRLVRFGRFEAAKGKRQTLTVMLDDPPDGEELELTPGEIANPNLKIDIKPNTQLALNERQAFDVTLEIPPGLPPLDYPRRNPLKVPLQTTHPLVKEIHLRLELYSN